MRLRRGAPPEVAVILDDVAVVGVVGPGVVEGVPRHAPDPTPPCETDRILHPTSQDP